MVSYACNPSTGEAEAKGLMSETHLGYVESSRFAWSAKQDSCLKVSKQNNNWAFCLECELEWSDLI